MSTITKRISKVALLVAVLIVAVSATAQAQRFPGGFGGRIGPRVGFGLGIGRFYDPFWGPYYPYAGYPYVVEHPTASVRVEVVPKQTEVFVDGYFAGTAGNVRTTPGGHAITLFLTGYRTVTQNIYVAPGSTFKMQDTMDRLAAGEVSAPPPQPARPLRPVTPPRRRLTRVDRPAPRRACSVDRPGDLMDARAVSWVSQLLPRYTSGAHTFEV